MSSDLRKTMLRRINIVREQAGHAPLAQLPQGTREDPHGCVIARSLCDIAPDIFVSKDEIHLGENVTDEFWRIVGKEFCVHAPAGSEEAIKLNAKTRSFISSFDNETWPELVDPERPLLIST